MHQFDQEEALLAALGAREQSAFEFAVARYSGAMLATARAIVGSAHAEDVVQDAWITVFEKINAFERRSTLKTWIQRIVVNRAISYLRATSREVQAPVADGEQASDSWFDQSGGWLQGPVAWDTGSPEAMISAELLQACIDKHLQVMPENQRSLVVMRDMEGMAFEEICNTLSLSPSNARVLLHRGRLRLVTMINTYQETGAC